MKRPVKCRICGTKMYYTSHPNHTPEWTVEIKGGGLDGVKDRFYVHKVCWKKALKVLQVRLELDEILGI